VIASPRRKGMAETKKHRLPKKRTTPTAMPTSIPKPLAISQPHEPRVIQ